MLWAEVLRRLATTLRPQKGCKEEEDEGRRSAGRRGVHGEGCREKGMQGGGRGAGRKREALPAGRLLAHMAPSCWVALWRVPHPDVCSAPRPGSGWLSNIPITETISEEAVFSASGPG